MIDDLPKGKYFNKMLNNLIFIWLTTIIIFIIFNIILRFYKIYRFRYLFTFTIDKFYNVNNNIVAYFIRFKFTSYNLTENSYISLLKTVISLINNNDLTINHNFYLTFFKFNNNTKSLIPISNPYLIKYNQPLNVNYIFNNIKWTELAFTDNNLKDVVIMIKLVN